MNYEPFLNPLVVRFATLVKDESAGPFFDHMSDAFIWPDERLFGLTHEEMGCLRSLFRYRMGLIVREPDDRFESLWQKLKEIYPSWIGFDPVRCSYSEKLALEYEKIKKQPLI